MSQLPLFQRVEKIIGQAESSLLKPNAGLDFALSNANARGLPPIEISPLHGKFLAIQAQLIGAKSVLEIGTLGGYSSLCFAGTGAQVTSLEINPKHRDVALESVRHAGLGDRVEIILGPALDSLPVLQEQGKKFDMVFIDADWDHQWEYFQWAIKLARPNGCIYVDNVVREILESDGEVSDKKETLLTKLATEDRVHVTLVTTASSHKQVENEMFDGFLLAVVKG